MKVKLKGPITNLDATSTIEDSILNGESINTKLAFSQANINNEDILIGSEQDVLYLDIKNKQANIDITKEGFVVYLLRVFLDALHVYNDNLPLHASMVKVGEKSLIFTGGTNHGKSVVANTLNQLYNGIVVGDDHLIVSNNLVNGNNVARVRNLGSQRSSYVANNTPVVNLDDYSFYIVNLNHHNSYESMGLSKLMQRQEILRSALKYLKNDILVNNCSHKTSDIVGHDILKNYLDLFEKFTSHAERITEVRGSLDYVVDRITNAEELKK
jgi:hypothetical protein